MAEMKRDDAPSDPCDLCGKPFDVAPVAGVSTTWLCSRCDAAATVIDAQRAKNDAPLVTAAPPYTEIEVEELARFFWHYRGLDTVNPAWEALGGEDRVRMVDTVRGALHGKVDRVTAAALDLMRRAEDRGARRAYAAQDANLREANREGAAEALAGTLPITRAEAELFDEALNHLPGFVDDPECGAAAMLAKLRAFLDGVKS